MALTPATLPRHELNGLTVEVVDAANPDLVGIAGRVVSETERTLCVEGVQDGAGRVWRVPKAAAVFEFAITDETRSGYCRRPRRSVRVGRRRGLRYGGWGSTALTSRTPHGNCR
jgi:RNase P/RNase MRP subunit p29